jgi:hypothetical protein
VEVPRQSAAYSIDLIAQVAAESQMTALDLSASMLISDWRADARSRAGMPFDAFLKSYLGDLRAQMKSKTGQTPTIRNIALDIDRTLAISDKDMSVDHGKQAIEAEAARLGLVIKPLGTMQPQFISIPVDASSDPNGVRLVIENIAKALCRPSTRLIVENSAISSMFEFRRFAKLSTQLGHGGDSKSIGVLLNLRDVSFRPDKAMGEMIGSLGDSLVAVRIGSQTYGSPDQLGEQADKRMFVGAIKALSDRKAWWISLECFGPQLVSSKSLFPGITRMKRDLEAAVPPAPGRVDDWVEGSRKTGLPLDARN